MTATAIVTASETTTTPRVTAGSGASVGTVTVASGESASGRRANLRADPRRHRGTASTKGRYVRRAGVAAGRASHRGSSRRARRDIHLGDSHHGSHRDSRRMGDSHGRRYVPRPRARHSWGARRIHRVRGSGFRCGDRHGKESHCAARRATGGDRVAREALRPRTGAGLADSDQHRARQERRGHRERWGQGQRGASPSQREAAVDRLASSRRRRPVGRPRRTAVAEAVGRPGHGAGAVRGGARGHVPRHAGEPPSGEERAPRRQPARRAPRPRARAAVPGLAAAPAVESRRRQLKVVVVAAAARVQQQPRRAAGQRASGLRRATRPGHPAAQAQAHGEVAASCACGAVAHRHRCR